MNNEWLTSAFGPDELAPEDVILHKVVQDVLKPDPTLRRIFGEDGIRALPWLDPLDFDNFPVLDVAAFSLEEVPGVGVLSDKITLYFQIRFERVHTEILQPNQATMATLDRHLVRLLSAEGNKQLHHTIGSTTIQLVRRSNPGPKSFRVDPNPEGDRYAFNAIRAWEYEVHTDVETGRIRNLVLAGG